MKQVKKEKTTDYSDKHVHNGSAYLRKECKALKQSIFVQSLGEIVNYLKVSVLPVRYQFNDQTRQLQ